MIKAKNIELVYWISGLMKAIINHDTATSVAESFTEEQLLRCFHDLVTFH